MFCPQVSKSKPVSKEGFFSNPHSCLIYLLIKDGVSWIPGWPHTCYVLEDHQKSPSPSLYFRCLTANLCSAAVSLRALSLSIKHAANWATPQLWHWNIKIEGKLKMKIQRIFKLNLAEINVDDTTLDALVQTAHNVLLASSLLKVTSPWTWDSFQFCVL